jgi:VanZ family protein
MGSNTPPSHPGDPTGERALAAGIAAVAASFVPMFGEFIAIPVAVLAIVLGLVGIRRYHEGRAARVVDVAAAACGTILGAATSFIIVIVLAAAHLRP